MTYIRLSISSFFSELSNKDTEKKKRFKLFYCNKGENDGQWMIGDVRMMGWKLDKNGNLHPDEERMFAGIVKRFKHHENIMWGIEESVNKLPRTSTSHFMKRSELIAKLDNHHHISKFTISIIMCREAEKVFR